MYGEEKRRKKKRGRDKKDQITYLPID